MSEPHPIPSEAGRDASSAKRISPPASLAFFGVFLPGFALFIELVGRVCANNFFDPLPTYGHAIAFSVIPFACLWILVRWEGPGEPGWELDPGLLRDGKERIRPVPLRGLLYAASASIGIALYFTIMFAPLLPISALGSLFVLGTAGFAPLLALYTTVKTRRVLATRLRARDGFVPRHLWVLGLSLLGTFAIDAGQIAAGLGVRWVQSNDEVRRQRGLWVLRHFANREALRRGCWGERIPQGLLGSFRMAGTRRFEGVPSTRMDELYYQVTGHAHTDDPRPRLPRGGTLLGGGPSDDFLRDDSQGTERTGAVLTDLALDESSLHARVDPEAGIAYMEWTLTFANANLRTVREARALIALPPGSVVSRVTAWIGGEEREAAFAERTRTSRAYFSVVPEVPQARGIDPVLVVTGGPDRVRLQAYPVSPRRTMKLRLGITAPFFPIEDRSMVLARPRITACNFERPEKESTRVDGPGVRGSSSDPWLCTAPWPSDTELEVLDPRGEGRIAQTLERRTFEPLERLILVMDSSVDMEDPLRAVARVFETLEADVAVDLVVAGDQVAVPLEGERSMAEVARALRAIDAIGGTDSLPALVRARELLAKAPERSLVLWIHGPQPIAFTEREEAMDDLDLVFGRRFHELQIVPGRHTLVEGLEERVQAVPSLGSPVEDLERFLARHVLGVEHAAFTRTREALTEAPPLEPSFRDHVVRLWAKESIEESLRAGDLETALTRAMRHQLVTPVSGAVVLETAEQYELHGLRPAARTTVPSVPEPGFWVLCGLLVLSFSYARWRGFGG